MIDFNEENEARRIWAQKLKKPTKQFIEKDGYAYHGMTNLIADMKRDEALAIQARQTMSKMRQAGFLPNWN